LEHIDNASVTQITYTSIQAAKDSVRHGITWGAIHIPRNFSQDFISRVYACTTADNETLQGSTIKIYLDNTNQQIAYLMKELVFMSFQKFSKTLMRNSGLLEEMGDIPVMFEDPVFGGMQSSFTEYMAPGLILSVAYFMAVGLTSLAFVVERKEGLLDRTLVCGVSTVEVLMGHFVTQFVVMCIQCALSLMFIIVVFQTPCRGPVWEVILLTVLQGMCGMCYGLLISAFCDEENSAVMVALGSFYPNLMLCGVIWPVEGMPKVLQYISKVLPQTYAVEGLRALMLRAWDFSYEIVWMSYLVTTSWMLFFLILAAIIFRIRG
jgi:huntingtin